MLIWFMTNPFAVSVLILVIADLRDPFTYKLEECCKRLGRVPESASGG